MYHKSHIGLVDTHSECYGGDYHIHFLQQESILVGTARCSIHAGMIRECLYVIDAEHFSKFLHPFAAQAVYYTALAWMGLYELYDLLVNHRSLGTYLVIKIRTVERRLVDHGISHPKALLYVMLHFRGGCSCESNHRTSVYLIDDRAYPAVFRTEIMPPLRDAMSFVDSIE